MMKFGVTMFATDETLQPVPLARAVEELGFDSIWLPEHSHIPTSRETPWGGRQDAPPLPPEYWHTIDVFVALAAAAAVTERIKLCTGITLLAQRDPIWTAKEVASLDLISGGRVIFGVGYGWNREEMASHGILYEGRRRILIEKLELMKTLWTDDEASYHGEILRLEPTWAWPKPVQRPHPPIIFGATPGPKTLRDIVAHADGWIPIGKRLAAESIEEVRRALDEAGRDTANFEVSVFAAGADPSSIESLTAAGVDRLIFSIPSDPPDAVLTRLNEISTLANEFSD